jgi:hypothetical protein
VARHNNPRSRSPVNGGEISGKPRQLPAKAVVGIHLFAWVGWLHRSVGLKSGAISNHHVLGHACISVLAARAIVHSDPSRWFQLVGFRREEPTTLARFYLRRQKGSQHELNAKKTGEVARRHQNY